jgi:hypothetical protein
VPILVSACTSSLLFDTNSRYSRQHYEYYPRAPSEEELNHAIIHIKNALAGKFHNSVCTSIQQMAIDKCTSRTSTVSQLTEDLERWLNILEPERTYIRGRVNSDSTDDEAHIGFSVGALNNSLISFLLTSIIWSRPIHEKSQCVCIRFTYSTSLVTIE